ncbi:MAG: hypothetical protein LQ348_000511 [Seirophora lacunosa]|nr:MAG: hypothetical protein LQ348_000511 [Seirophora lacunosa]
MLAKLGLSSLLLVTLAVCDPEGHPWQHPLPTDRRSPCPGVNALANHGYLPRNGRNISLEQFIAGITEGYNYDINFTTFAVDVYQNFTTTGYNNTLNLNDLEHHATNLSVLLPPPQFPASTTAASAAMTAAHFQNDTISISDAARARKDRFAAAKAVNPEFTPSILSSLGETALFLKTMQGQDKETKTEYVKILFREERIPFDEGYKRSNVTITNGDLGKIAGDVAIAWLELELGQ